ncbi:MAG: hypothetical protein KBF19_01445 [Negativicutes bacterium]|nr:hypothetical protein [Negativicutes bacterium]
MSTSEQSRASALGDQGLVLWNLMMGAAKRELKEADIFLSELQESRLGVHMVALVNRQQKRELFPEIEEALMNEISLWGWAVAERTTTYLNLPEWKISKAEQFLLAIHFESAKLENSLIEP